MDFQADYDMTTREVYRQLSLDSIQTYRNLEVMCYAWQTQHLDISLPSWIPRWELAFDVRTLLLPFLYDAARETTPKLLPSSQLDTLIVEGLSLGPIMELDCTLRFGEHLDPIEGSNNAKPIKDLLMIMSRILVQDRWQEDVTLETTAKRTHENLQAHFADFCAFLLPLMKLRKQDVYIPTTSIWCNSCQEIINQQRKTTLGLARVYNCPICKDGDFDLCATCYDLGKRCSDQTHVLKTITTTSLWCPYSEDIIDQLETHAATGDGDRFFTISKAACRERIFIRTAKGWQGLAAQTVEPGDTLVVLFGSRIPVILRECNGFYRLISDCYFFGLMDGEAIQMWEDGALEKQTFVIQ